MSQALASARKRRAPTAPNPVPILPNQQHMNNAPPQSGLTLPQVISVIDRRLINLETIVNKQQTEIIKMVSNDTLDDNTLGQSEFVDHSNDIVKLNENINEIANELNTRYDILANEILDIKNMLLKLQSFTMEVNKTLMDERTNILTDFYKTTGVSNEINETKFFSLEDTSLNQNDSKNIVIDDFERSAVPSYSTESSIIYTSSPN